MSSMIAVLRLNSGNQFFDYNFSDTNFIYGPNTVGKTAMAITIDTVLAKTKNRAFEYSNCLKNVDSIDINLRNDKRKKWFRRDRQNNFFIKDGDDGAFQQVDIDYYKNEIEKFYSISNNYKEIFADIYDEDLTFRAFSFLNFIDENDVGNLNAVFTRSKDYEHIFRIRNIMQLLFNYENIEKIYRNDLEIKQLQLELENLKYSEQNFNYNSKIINGAFNKLNLKFSKDMHENYNTFIRYRDSFSRDKLKNSGNYIPLLKESVNLSEEIKLLEFKSDQSKSLQMRNTKVLKLMKIFKNLLEENPDYREYINLLECNIEQRENDNIILSAVDYRESLNKLYRYKAKVDLELKKISNMPNELKINDVLKTLGIVENAFLYTLNEVDYVSYESKEEKLNKLLKENKELRKNFNRDKIDNFNKDLTSMYLGSRLNVKCVQDDLNKEDFNISYDPIRIFIQQNSRNHNMEDIASKSRMTFIQMLCYIEFFKYIKNNFEGLCLIPFIVLDGVSTQFDDHFEEIYDYFCNVSKKIGLQTFTFSFKKKNNIDNCTYIDISAGFNPFFNLNR